MRRLLFGVVADLVRAAFGEGVVWTEVVQGEMGDCDELREER